MVSVILSLGSNIEPRRGYIEAMERELAKVLRAPLNASRLMETQPVEVDGEHPWYIDRIISGSYEASALDLLFSCNEIERKLGRIRPYVRAPRTADIDILLFGDSIIETPRLRIPHPGLLSRRFCLEGAMDIEPQRRIPGLGITVREQYRRLNEEVLNQKIVFLNRKEEVACTCSR